MEKILSDIPPFRLCEGIYFVGSRKVSAHLFESEHGLILLDTGYPRYVRANLREHPRAWL